MIEPVGAETFHLLTPEQKPLRVADWSINFCPKNRAATIFYCKYYSNVFELTIKINLSTTLRHVTRQDVDAASWQQKVLKLLRHFILSRHPPQMI